MFKRVIVAHEGNWLTSDFRQFYGYDTYEDAQRKYGIGLIFVSKEYSDVLNRTLFSFEFEDFFSEAILAVPATGEEIYFEVYGSDNNHGLVLLTEREL